MSINYNKALEILIEGNERFCKGKLNHPNQNVERRESLANGQDPVAVVVGCADSRVTPEILFDQGIGDLFVIRSAGNLADENSLASIEYSVLELKTKLVVVLGHVDCGAIKAAIKLKGTDVKLTESLNNLVEKIYPAIEVAEKSGGNILEKSIKENVAHVIKSIEKKSSAIAEKIAADEVKIVGAYYDWNSGKVHILD